MYLQPAAAYPQFSQWTKQERMAQATPWALLASIAAREATRDRSPRAMHQVELTVNPRLAAASSCLPSDPANIWLLTMAACCAHSCTTAGPQRDTSVCSSSQRPCCSSDSIWIPSSPSRRFLPSKDSRIAESWPISPISPNASTAGGQALRAEYH